jgi:hypothetical protein
MHYVGLWHKAVDANTAGMSAVWRKLTCCRKTANSRLAIRPRWCGRFALDTEGSNDERPCLHCLIGETIEDFYAEYGTLSGEIEAIDVDEIISALGKTMADLISGSEPSLRQRIIEDLMSEISRFEAEDASGLSGMHH